MSDIENKENLDFIRTIVVEDRKNGKNEGKVVTRFPPEPNGYLHIGHAKSICLNFGIAAEFQGVCHLRMDDTNPEKEEVEYIHSIQQDIKWLGFDWGDKYFFASDYFHKLYDFAEELIRLGKAYVDDLTADEIRQNRGTLTEPGKNSPYRDRSVEENLKLFREMKAGKYKDGEKVLRSRIDMASPNINMRDPIIYRIRHVSHHRTGNEWCIYPMYDFTHCLSDMLEGITHSLCTLEFENHRPLYDWYLDELKTPCHPRQIEFARLNLTYTVMSKRKLLQLVTEKFVDGWDDPRMPTISGIRRRGYSPESIKDFMTKVGIAKVESNVDVALLEFCLREDLNNRALRRMVVMRPLKLVIINYPEDQVEWFDAENNPEDPGSGTRKIPFSREVYIEQDDFREDPPKKYFRLSPGKEVRLKHAYYVKCVDVIKDEAGSILEVHCTYDPDSRGGWTDDGRKVKGTSHWVSAAHAEDVELRLYDRLFQVEDPDDVEEGQTFLDHLNPNSIEILKGCKAEPGLVEEGVPGVYFQFLRQGYFCADSKYSTKENLVFNRTVTLKDSWAKIEKKMGGN